MDRDTYFEPAANEDFDDGDRQYDERCARVDAGELCPDCDHQDVKHTTSGPAFALPMFECRLCGCLWFDAVTRPSVDEFTLPLFPERAA